MIKYLLVLFVTIPSFNLVIDNIKFNKNENFIKIIEIDTIVEFIDNDKIKDTLFYIISSFKKNNLDSFFYSEKFKLSKLGKFQVNNIECSEKNYYFYDFDGDGIKEILSNHHWGEEIDTHIRKFKNNRKIDTLMYVYPLAFYKNKYYYISNDFKNIKKPYLKNNKLLCSINHQIDFDYIFETVKNQYKLPVITFLLQDNSKLDSNNIINLKNLEYINFTEILKKTKIK